MRLYDSMPDKKEITRRIEDYRNSESGSLNLSNLNMTELPDEIAELKNLISLDVSYNHLRTIPDWICFHRSLIKINLRGNSINTLPDSFAELKKLRFLDIGINGFKSVEFEKISECLKKLELLEHLDLEAVNIKTLPYWIGDFPNLEFLNLRYCELNTLPDTIKKLVNLKTFYLGFLKELI